MVVLLLAAGNDCVSVSVLLEDSKQETVSASCWVFESTLNNWTQPLCPDYDSFPAVACQKCHMWRQQKNVVMQPINLSDVGIIFIIHGDIWDCFLLHFHIPHFLVMCQFRIPTLSFLVGCVPKSRTKWASPVNNGLSPGGSRKNLSGAQPGWWFVDFNVATRQKCRFNGYRSQC